MGHFSFIIFTSFNESILLLLWGVGQDAASYLSVILSSKSEGRVFTRLVSCKWEEAGWFLLRAEGMLWSLH